VTGVLAPVAVALAFARLRRLDRTLTRCEQHVAVPMLRPLPVATIVRCCAGSRCSSSYAIPVTPRRLIVAVVADSVLTHPNK
jgi:hypothetical protein